MKQVDASPTVDRLVTWSLDHPLSALVRYTAATVLMVGVALLRAAFVTDLLPWLLFVPVILVVSLLMGRSTGVYASMLAAVLAAATIAKADAPTLLTAPQWLATALFIVVAIGVVLLASDLRAAFRRARLAMIEREMAHAQLLEKDAQRELLTHELGHRMKNLLAVVQAIAGQTLRQATDLKAASEVLGFRLAALGKATDALTATEWQSADLVDLAEKTLDLHDGNAGRITISGPRLRFSPEVAMALTLTLHELVTNAAKYGALSNTTGHVDLRWSVEPGANGDKPRFKLTWRENGGPPVNKPTRRGFGSVMIERSLQSYLRGETSVEYRPEGLVFTIDAPLTGIAAEGEQAWEKRSSERSSLSTTSP